MKKVIMFIGCMICLSGATVGVLAYRDYRIEENATKAYTEYLNNEQNAVIEFNATRDKYVSDISELENGIIENLTIVKEYIDIIDKATEDGADAKKRIELYYEDLALSGKYEELKATRDKLDSLAAEDRAIKTEDKDILSMSNSFKEVYKVYLESYNMANTKVEEEIQLYKNEYDLLLDKADQELSSWSLKIPSYREVDERLYTYPEDIVGWYRNRE